MENNGVWGWVLLVTPCVGVWIEILISQYWTKISLSLPAWECGLKSLEHIQTSPKYRHSLRGSVD